MELAKVGDVIECDVSNPSPATLRARLDTPEACAEGNSLLMDENSGWRLAPKCGTCGKFIRRSGHCADCDDTPH